jgi:hypothetical protein
VGLGLALFQRGPAPEGGGPSAGADPPAVLGDAIEIDQVLLTPDGHRVGEQVVEELQVLDAEVGQRVVVDADAAAPPAEGVVVRAEVIQGAGTADALQRGVQPQGSEDARVGGRASGMPGNGADAGVQVGQVEALDETPDDTRLVVVGEQVVPRHRWEQLLAVRPTQTGSRSGCRAAASRRKVVVSIHAAVVGKPDPTVTPREG